MKGSCSPWTLFNYSGAVKGSHNGVVVVLVAVEVEQVGTLTARLDLKSPADPPYPTTDTLSPFQLQWMSTLRCNDRRRNNRRFLTQRILLDFSSKFWRLGTSEQ